MVVTPSAVSGNEGKQNLALRGSSGEDGEKNVSKYGEEYLVWKSNIPVLYDWFTNHSNTWPSLSCRHVIDLMKLNICLCYLYENLLTLSPRSEFEVAGGGITETDKSVPNTLIIANCDVVKPRVAAENHIANFNEEARSPFVRKYKTIIHPGELPLTSTSYDIPRLAARAEVWFEWVERNRNLMRRTTFRKKTMECIVFVLREASKDPAPIREGGS
ncbi:hypothetical protein H5410_037073 [Solanum commersonii]|uniref:Histone-binding protein RBBP4-like N-terminal domain-containing protein n=1 Tax=Solanum commersonii TaxID=4109 RepID=A0A9J5Y634_SOLCO|nr:hypothetical protein H5410_037073 [Solanum commersonii]